MQSPRATVRDRHVWDVRPRPALYAIAFFFSLYCSSSMLIPRPRHTNRASDSRFFCVISISGKASFSRALASTSIGVRSTMSSLMSSFAQMSSIASSTVTIFSSACTQPLARELREFGPRQNYQAIFVSQD